jgi:hypothetical protein
MHNRHLRAIILRLQDRLSDNDRKRLHFFLGNDVPRRIRDDQSLGGTLSLMESLFDQDKINEQDFNFLINAFDEIQCIDAVKLLRGHFLFRINIELFHLHLEHMKQMQSTGINQSVQSLASIMPIMVEQLINDQDDDKYSMQNSKYQPLDKKFQNSISNLVIINQKNSSGKNNIMVNNNNTNINPVTVMIDNQTISPSRSKRKQLSNTSWITSKCLLRFILLLIIAFGIVISVCIYQIYHKKMQDQQIEQLNILRSEDNQTIQRLNNRLKYCKPNCKIIIKSFLTIISSQSEPIFTIENLRVFSIITRFSKSYAF